MTRASSCWCCLLHRLVSPRTLLLLSLSLPAILPPASLSPSARADERPSLPAQDDFEAAIDVARASARGQPDGKLEIFVVAR